MAGDGGDILGPTDITITMNDRIKIEGSITPVNNGNLNNIPIDIVAYLRTSNSSYSKSYIMGSGETDSNGNFEIIVSPQYQGVYAIAAYVYSKKTNYLDSVTVN